MEVSGLSSFFHSIFPANCDLCYRTLSGRDFHRVCLRCVAGVAKELVRYANVCPQCCHQLDKKGVCPSCELNRKQNLPTVNQSLLFNRDKAQKLVYQYKFFHHRSYAKVIATLMVKYLSNFFRKQDVIVPITLGKRGMFERDFCPVREVVREMVKKFNKLNNSSKRSTGSKLEVVEVLKRNEKSYTKAQHQKTALERKSLTGKYLYLSKYRGVLEGKRVVLVDDVHTTGSTINFCAELIRTHNPGCRVTALTVLKTLLGEEEQDDGKKNE